MISMLVKTCMPKNDYDNVDDGDKGDCHYDILMRT